MNEIPLEENFTFFDFYDEEHIPGLTNENKVFFEGLIDLANTKIEYNPLNEI